MGRFRLAMGYFLLVSSRTLSLVLRTGRRKVGGMLRKVGRW